MNNTVKKGAPLSWLAQVRRERLIAEYKLISALQWPFEKIFWLLQQRKGRLQDRIVNEEGA